MVPRGLFLYGEVGTGKSMLMDTFYAAVATKRKCRVHFHSFMQQVVHRRIHELKLYDLSTHGRNFKVDTLRDHNPIYRVARQLASELNLICFDEFQITDVADALLLSQLFSVLFERGTVVVATSNRPLSDLYEGGLNRSYFLPFLDLMKRHCIVHNLNGGNGIDYRRLLVSKDKREDYFFSCSKFIKKMHAPNDKKITIHSQGRDERGSNNNETNSFHETFLELMNGVSPVQMTVKVAFNRTISVKRAHPEGVVVRFTFDELCNTELGSSDYRAIAEQFQIVMIQNIPCLSLEKHNEARRFITLVDELYEAKCSLACCSAVACPDDLFFCVHDGESVKTVVADSVEMKVDELFGIDVAQSNGRAVGELASVKELSFAFRRAASRIIEMCSKTWWERV